MEFADRWPDVADLDADLAQALSKPELEVVYQPRFSLGSNQLCGAEALVRWQHPNYGLLFPAYFMREVQERGAVGALDAFVVAQVCSHLVDWERAGELAPDFYVAVNISGLDVRDPTLPERARAIVGHYGTRPGRLRFEWTGAALIKDTEVARDAPRLLGALGIGLDIDNFGVGYASLRHLQYFRPGRVGLHRSWVAEAGTRAASGGVLGSTILLSHRVGVLAVAKGIETAEQLDRLVVLGCDEGQGFYLGRPASPEAFGALLRTAHQMAQ